MQTARELMTKEPKMIASGDSLEDVVKLFLSIGITSSPVMSPMGKVLGILTELSLVKAYMLHRAKFHKEDKVGHHLQLLEMPSYISEESTLAEVLKEIIVSPTHRLLVTNERKKITGIISPKDLMRALLGDVNPSQTLKQKLNQAEALLKKSLEEKLDMEKSLDVYQRVFHETPYMIHAINEKGEIIMANKRAHEALGYKHNELIGMTIENLYARPMREQAMQSLNMILKGDVLNVLLTSLVKKDGSLLNCDAASSALRDENGKIVSALTALRPLDREDFLKTVTQIVDDQNGPLANLLNSEKTKIA